MRVEIPDCARCCVCVPLRYGIIIFGYLNLTLYIFLLSLEYFLPADQYLKNTTMVLYRGVGLFLQLWLTILLYILEIIFNVILLIGAHKQKPQLLRAYYYYGITTTAAILCCFLFDLSNIDFRDSIHQHNMHFHIVELCIICCGVGFHVYLLLLIRSELKKLNERKLLRFSNHNQIDGIFLDSKDNEDIDI